MPDLLPAAVAPEKKRTKIFSQNELTLLVLHLLQMEPCHGYGLIKALDNYSRGVYVPSPGVIYPVLTLLQEQGLIVEGEEDSGRKPFHITEAGTAWMQERRDQMKTTKEKLHMLVMAKHPQRISAIENAFDILKMNLRAKQHEKPLTEKQIEKISAAIVAAANKIKNI